MTDQSPSFRPAHVDQCETEAVELFLAKVDELLAVDPVTFPPFLTPALTMPLHTAAHVADVLRRHRPELDEPEAEDGEKKVPEEGVAVQTERVSTFPSLGDYLRDLLTPWASKPETRPSFDDVLAGKVPPMPASPTWRPPLLDPEPSPFSVTEEELRAPGAEDYDPALVAAARKAVGDLYAWYRPRGFFVPGGVVSANGGLAMFPTTLRPVEGDVHRSEAGAWREHFAVDEPYEAIGFPASSGEASGLLVPGEFESVDLGVYVLSIDKTVREIAKMLADRPEPVELAEVETFAQPDALLDLVASVDADEVVSISISRSGLSVESSNDETPDEFVSTDEISEAASTLRARIDAGATEGGVASAALRLLEALGE